MNSKNIENLIKTDLETFLHYKSLKGKVTVNDAIEIAAYVAANFFRVIFAKNKELKPEELNGVFGIISNVYNDLFENQITKNDYKKISTLTFELLKNTDFDQLSTSFFKNLIQNTTN
ncbi:hypothetical protein H1R17_08100 [Flavobacterium sp. xlx-214]|uniref:hypothetical protein n=1 Tax=unclassified Flavobacterium TaxID=196869 RepID=UPI0013D1B6DE|nr:MULTISPECIES: hypothetical protein [unclassified Flavobacterium]MBA5793262.1 hypothetical protein [Flavobacterium sp. xlx-221]QMI82455.1 hypothetical protein H1R17_08100 [Flavobacterium sp. xlx-214]